jgi:hypothetical protein
MRNHDCPIFGSLGAHVSGKETFWKRNLEKKLGKETGQSWF